ncbi:hypothetical protein MHU86_22127 [Fragilaria crotonensis]|nr:hypothetical protein MHU86_22127 [Fragilaria crotonensis]
MVSRAVYAVDYDAITKGDHRAGRCEMDSHADTCVAGGNCVVLEYSGRNATVEAYSPDYPSKTVPIATVATAYDCPTSNATFVLIINEALFFGESLSFSLLSPNQLRDNDVHVDERHRQYAPDSIFGLHVPSEPLTIPFDLEGVIAGFTTRLPTQAELDDVALHVELTSDVEWIPSNFALSLVEEDSKTDDSTISTLRARRLKVLRSKSDKHRIKSCIRTLEATQSLFEIETANEVGTLDNDPILRRVAALTTYEADTKVYAIRTGDVTSEVTPENVAKRWLVGIETAKKTLNVTTQKRGSIHTKPSNAAIQNANGAPTLSANGWDVLCGHNGAQGAFSGVPKVRPRDWKRPWIREGIPDGEEERINLCARRFR